MLIILGKKLMGYGVFIYFLKYEIIDISWL